jgi:hypothetical protein
VKKFFSPGIFPGMFFVAREGSECVNIWRRGIRVPRKGNEWTGALHVSGGRSGEGSASLALIRGRGLCFSQGVRGVGGQRWRFLITFCHDIVMIQAFVFDVRGGPHYRSFDG